MSLPWSMHSNSLNCFFVGSDNFFLALIAWTYILRLDNIEGALSQQLKSFPKIQGQSCAPPITFVMFSRLAGASLKSNLRQDKLSSMFYLAALHPSLKSSCSICNQQLPKLNTVFPVSFSTHSCITSYNSVKIMSIHK